MGCVYLATNRINGKQYVGQSVDFDRRKKGHRYDAVSGKGCLFHSALRKYGFDAFDWEILKYREFLTWERDKAWMNRWEKCYIKKLDTMSPNGYNLTEGGDGGVGFTHSIATRKIISAKLMGHSVSEYCKEATRKANLGRLVSEELKNIHRTNTKQLWQSKKYRLKCNKAREKALADPEVRLRWISAVKKAVSKPEYKVKQRKAQLGKKRTEDTKYKMRIAGKNKWLEPEYRAKHIEGLKRGWIKRKVKNVCITFAST